MAGNVVAAEAIAEFSGDQIEAGGCDGLAILQPVSSGGCVIYREARAAVVPLEPNGIGVGRRRGNEEIRLIETHRHPFAAEGALHTHVVAKAVLGEVDHPGATHRGGPIANTGGGCDRQQRGVAVKASEGQQLAFADNLPVDQFAKGTTQAQLGQSDIGGIVQLGGAESGGAFEALLAEIGLIQATAVAHLHRIGGQLPLPLGTAQQQTNGLVASTTAGHRDQIRGHGGLQADVDRLVVGGGDQLDRPQRGQGSPTGRLELLPRVAELRRRIGAELVTTAREIHLAGGGALLHRDRTGGGAEELQLLKASGIAVELQFARAACLADHIGFDAIVVITRDRFASDRLQRIGRIKLIHLHAQRVNDVRTGHRKVDAATRPGQGGRKPRAAAGGVVEGEAGALLIPGQPDAVFRHRGAGTVVQYQGVGAVSDRGAKASAGIAEAAIGELDHPLLRSAGIDKAEPFKGNINGDVLGAGLEHTDVFNLDPGISG